MDEKIPAPFTVNEPTWRLYDSPGVKWFNRREVVELLVVMFPSSDGPDQTLS